MNVRLDHEPERWEPAPDRPRSPTPGWPQPFGPPDAGAGGVGAWLEERLFGQRIVLLQGPLTSEAATRAAAAMLTLDALGAEPVRLHINAPDGDLAGVFALIDTLDAMRAPVHALATAEVGGGVVGVFAAARRRQAYPHARFRLAEPKVTGVAGTADEVLAAASRYLQSVEDLVLRVAAASGQPRSRVEDDFSTGRLLTSAEAIEYGLVESIVSPGGS